MKSGKNEQTPIGLYNAYKDGLFGHQFSSKDIAEMGVDGKKYQETKNTFTSLCDRLGGRVLNVMTAGGVLITPEPISTELGEYLGNVLGVDSSRVALINAQGISGTDLPVRILSDNKTMDQLRNLAKNSVNPVLYPRTLTPDTARLAKEIGASHIHQMPSDGVRHIDGIYPTLNYLEKHSAAELNSKVLNYERLKEIDKKMGTQMAPIGDVAFDLDKAVSVVKGLWQSGLDAIIKADLSVDGLGNVKLPRPNNITDFADLKIQIQEKLSEKGIPLGKNSGVVVTELLAIIYDPSVEWFIYPKNKESSDPKVYYTCGMLIENGGFGGSVIEDPALSGQNGYLAGVPDAISKHRAEYKNLIQKGIKVGTQFVKEFRNDGYVGIADCDFGISLDKSGKLRASILEFNLIRETGGTAPYQIKARLGNHGTTIARDSVSSPQFSGPFNSVIDYLARQNLELTANRAKGINSGVVVLGQSVENGVGKIMTLTYGQNYQEAYCIDQELKRRAS